MYLARSIIPEIRTDHMSAVRGLLKASAPVPRIGDGSPKSVSALNCRPGRIEAEPVRSYSIQGTRPAFDLRQV